MLRNEMIFLCDCERDAWCRLLKRSLMCKSALMNAIAQGAQNI
jgi:hypothetical protein